MEFKNKKVLKKFTVAMRNHFIYFILNNFSTQKTHKARNHISYVMYKVHYISFLSSPLYFIF